MGTKSNPKYVDFSRSYRSLQAMIGAMPKVTTSQILKLENKRTGADNPMWKSKVMSGQSATSAFTGEKTHLKYAKGMVRAQLIGFPGYPGQGAMGWSDSLATPEVPSLLGFPVSLINNAKNKAAIGIRGKVKEQSTSFTGLTMLGELRETLHMIRHPAEAMREYSNNFFKGMYAKKLRHSRQKFGHMLANSWLEFTFGLVPFMSDVEAIADALIPKLDEPRIIRLSFTAQDASASSYAGTINSGGLSITVPYHRDYINEASCRYLLGYRVKSTGPLTNLQRLKQLGGFNLQEVIPTAWELLPWSFFIDYFSNIGDVISANLVSLEDVVWCQLTTRKTMLIRQSALGSKGWSADWNLKFVEGEDFISSATVIGIERAAASIPFGELRFELPGRTNQFLNMVALAQGQFVPLNERKRR
nr:MAG: hypothetical protein 1 [Leviviridae sp.]